MILIYSITHRPDLSYKKYFYSTDVFKTITSSVTETEENEPTKSSEIYKLIKSIDSNSSIVPVIIQKIISSTISNMESEYANVRDFIYINNKSTNQDSKSEPVPNKIKTDDEDKNPDDTKKDPSNPNINDPMEEDIEYEEEISEDEDPPDDPFNDDLTLVIMEPKPVEEILPKIEREYAEEVEDIFKDYLTKLQLVLSTNITNILMSLSLCDKAEYLLSDYTQSTKNISDKNKHLSDMIISSNIIRKNNELLMIKLQNTRQISAHIKMCKTAKDLRKRYYTSNYKDQNNYLDMASNKNLEIMRATYDKKYKDSFFGLYKYLNSSVILIDEQLKRHTNEIQSKVILINDKEGEYNDENKTNSGQSDSKSK